MTAQPILIDIKDRRILLFDHLQTGLPITSDNTNLITLAYDLEKMEGGEWLVHIDTWFIAGGIAGIISRVIYSLKCKEEEIWAEGVSREFIKPALQTCQASFNHMCKGAGIDASLPDSFVDEGRINQCYGMLMNAVSQMKNMNEDKQIRKSNFLTISANGKSNFEASWTIIILDLVLVQNKVFNREHNINSLQQYIPLPIYFTIKLKFADMINKGIAPGLSMKQTVIYIWMMQCACSLLLSSHGETMSEELTKAGFTEENQKHYIKEVSKALKELNDMLQKKGVHITNLTKMHDWAAMVK